MGGAWTSQPAPPSRPWPPSAAARRASGSPGGRSLTACPGFLRCSEAARSRLPADDCGRLPEWRDPVAPSSHEPLAEERREIVAGPGIREAEIGHPEVPGLGETPEGRIGSVADLGDARAESARPEGRRGVVGLAPMRVGATQEARVELAKEELVLASGRREIPDQNHETPGHRPDLKEKCGVLAQQPPTCAQRTRSCGSSGASPHAASTTE